MEYRITIYRWIVVVRASLYWLRSTEIQVGDSLGTASSRSTGQPIATEVSWYDPLVMVL